MAATTDGLRSRLQDLGVTKLSWALERADVDGHTRWTCEVQAANEMGGPIAIPADLTDVIEQVIHDEQIGRLDPGVWVMDVETGCTTHPQPRPGEGAGAPGIAERLP